MASEPGRPQRIEVANRPNRVPNARSMKIKSADFELSAPNLRGCPARPLPEFAFIGRSNVGKSSLINLLAGRSDLARVSDLPGKTRLLNFYLVNSAWRIVDLPGYGYAHVSKQERADFNEAVADFLTQRESLLHTCVLIDSRLPPQKIDLAFLEWLAGEGVSFSLVFTKTDKQSRSATLNAVDRFRQTARQELGVDPLFFLTSARTKDGRTDLLKHFAELMA